MNRKIIFFVIITALGIFAWSYFSNPETTEDDDNNTFIFACPSGVEIKISYDESFPAEIVKFQRVLS